MKNFLLLFLSFITFMSLLTTGCSREQEGDVQGEADPLPVLTNRIQQCSKLYTTEYRIHKIVLVEAEKKIESNFLGMGINVPLGERKLIIPMEATLKGYIDFSDFKEDDITIDGNQVFVTLPDPEVELTSTRIDHDGTKQYVSWYLSNFNTAEQTIHAAKGRRDIINKLKNDKKQKQRIVESARESAANLLIPLISQMGFEEENITIKFQREFSFDHLTILTD